jgi:hypothetical protein
MSDTKPSRAATAFAEKCRALSAPYDYAGLIQSELAGLLEMLKEQTCSINDCGHADCDKIRQTLAPWKPEK